MRFSRKKPVFLVLAAALFLAGCSEVFDMTVPAQVNVRKTRLQDTVRTETVDAAAVDPDVVNMIADRYLRNGRGPLALTMPYLAGGEAEVRIRGGEYMEAFRAYGVRDMQVDYVAMDAASHADKAVVSYQALAAVPPPECARLPGHDGAETLRDVEEYAFGCNVQSSISKMVARPADLMGNAGTSNDSARRQGAVVEPYVSGTPNERLEGLNSSDIAE